MNAMANAIPAEYRICTRCVMDTSDPDIEFDGEGVCNHCQLFDATISELWMPTPAGRARLESDIERVVRAGKGKEYDCILGLSGGIDSSYLAVAIKDFGLRPLVVHVDAGWNSELAVYNIERVVKYCGYELHTHVMDWEDVRDLQLAYLRAGVANQDVIQDHAFFATLYHFAVKQGIRTVVSGENVATESVFPAAWHHSNMDAVNLHAIHRRFGQRKLRHYRTIGMVRYYLLYPYFYRMNVLRPLNYLPYDKREALTFLESEVGYKRYGRKHGESVFTRFFQEHYLPEKFGIDKRRMHFSSMILSGQMTREEALAALAEPLYTAAELEQDKRYIARKLGIGIDEFESLIAAPGVHYSAYPNWDRRHRSLKRVQSVAESLLNRRISNRS